MSKSGGNRRIIGAAALMLALAPAPLAAQSAPDFSLPGSRPTTNPRAQGPVDPDHPVVRTAPRPTPSAAPPPVVPAPTPTASAPANAVLRGPSGTLVGTRPAAAANQRPTTPAPRPSTAAPTAGQPGAANPAAATGPAIPAPGPVTSTDASAIPVPGAVPTDSFALPSSAEAVPSGQPGWYWPWIAGVAALLAFLFGLLWWRLRKPKVALLEFERPEVPQPKPESAPEPEPAVAAPEPAPAPVLPEPQLAAAAPGLVVALEARRMNASLVATTLSYVVKLTNTTDQPLSALAVEGDMIAAHASLPTEKQIAHQGQRLELRHALVTLEPGESAEFSGDFRLPLSTLVPIRSGNAAFFVPLARLRVEASTPTGAPLVKVQTWVVGELPDQPGAQLRPFRLDLGPRTYSRVGQRAVN